MQQRILPLPVAEYPAVLLPVLDKPVQRPEAHLVSLHAVELCDLHQLPRPVPKARQMHDQVDTGGELGADRRHRQRIAAKEHHGLEARDHVPGGVGVPGGHRPVVAGVHGLQHVEGLRPSYLADDDSVRPHPKTRADQIPYGDRNAPLDVGVSCLQGDQIGDVTDLELRVVLDGDDALAGGDKVRERIQKGGLSGTRAAADEDVVAGGHQVL